MARLPLILFGLGLVAGCGDPVRELAPPAADRPWPVPPAVRADVVAEVSAAPAAAPEIAPGRAYDLPALIDLAQRHNPRTRIAWEEARQAALAVGIAEATFYPQLTASVVAGWQRTATTLDLPVLGQESVTTDLTGVATAVFAEWLLFDFGERAAAADMARNLSLAANVQFNLVHQEIIFAVSRAYHQLAAARRQHRAAERALASAGTIARAARARRDRGIGTEVEVAQARQQVAQARLALTRADGARTAARADLLAAMGLPPRTALEIATPERPLPPAIGHDIDHLIRQALAARPDVVAAVADLRAQQAGVAQARASFLPKVGVIAGAAYNDLGLSVNNTPNLYQPFSDTGVLFGVSMPLFDGGLRDSRLRGAESRLESARQTVRMVRDAAAREIVDAYEALQTGLAAWHAADELVAAAGTTARALRAAYDQGVGNLTEALIAESALYDAEQARAQAYADTQIAATALAFATGRLQ